MWWTQVIQRADRTNFGRITQSAVALSVAVLLLVSAMLQGFITLYTRGILQFQSPLVVMAASTAPDVATLTHLGDALEQYRVAQHSAAAPITQITPFLYRESMLLSRMGMQATVLKGIPLASLRSEQPAQIRWLIAAAEWNPDTLPVIVGAGLAGPLEPDATALAALQIIVPTAHGQGDVSSQRIPLQVVGIFRTGVDEFDRRFVLTPLDAMQRFVPATVPLTGWEISLYDASQSMQVANALEAHLGDAALVQEWRAMYRDAFEALATNQWLLSLLFGVFVIVAMGNVALLVLLRVAERYRTAAVLLALGAPMRDVTRAFWWSGVRHGSVGIFVGLLGGTVLALILQTSEWIRLDPALYVVSAVPALVTPWHWITIGGGSVLLCALCAWWAARRVTRLPLDQALGRGFV